ncbi:MAG TPA: signal peptidase I [Brevefilum fermentans]|jgi:signal peptidase I|uniref:Signal peptidase I n=1 Tax=Candidatus Brevifilum fermentans TaxID=1986204 RepID=A0A1Y6K5E3_9CHLR|nr:signal peptidase I [Brevefilum fermentans]MDI9566413.1 signal peptidase I [Chloroflexota bacterium]OQB82914.1 MAG: Signal peptidase IB [Chloroflexi bacterium ADurb.Bin120]SMX54922.1 Signal peptidase I [Brevefilum fermentans]HOM67303.1 signal peptidase I [Brevefilum fermentans]HPX94915.1 signal peptidase I [Brevefilum fermentans]
MLDTLQSEPTSANPADGSSGKSKRSGCLGFFIDTVETILLALVLFLAINALSARVRVENVSMKPTLQEGEFLLVNRVAYTFGQPSIGDIIVFHAPGASDMDYIKRVIGLPGDQVRITDGIVYVNNQPLYEPYIAESPRYTGTWDVPQNEYFVLGDNRNNSSDSHMWGFVPHEDIVGRALLIYWPLSEITLLRSSGIVTAIQ